MNTINVRLCFPRGLLYAAAPLRFWREVDRAGNSLICRTRRTRDGSVPKREALRLI